MVKCTKSQAGFTLVELAIVMIIIGLLIGGVLKGQQLITNAQITATVAQIKAMDAATTSFRDQYNGMPGDLLNVAARIANCAAAVNCQDGDGDGKVDNGAGGSLDFGTATPAGSEQLGYWSELNLAGLLSGIKPSNTATGDVWGGNYPASKIAGGGFDVGYYAGGTGLTKVISTGTAPGGHYFALHGTQKAAVGASASDSFLTPNQAARIDTKIDDGAPNTGTVLAAAATQTDCTDTTTTTGVYQENLTAIGCSLYIQFQN